MSLFIHFTRVPDMPNRRRLRSAADQLDVLPSFSLPTVGIVAPFRLLTLRSGTAYQMMSPPLRSCHLPVPFEDILIPLMLQHWLIVLVLSETIVVLVVALLLRPLQKYNVMMMMTSICSNRPHLCIVCRQCRLNELSCRQGSVLSCVSLAVIKYYH